MNNDLISRKVIKRLIGDKSIPIKFEEGTRGNWQNSSGVLLSDIYKAIDNAPTVKTYCYFCGQTEHGQIEARPQGEWVPVSERLPEEKINPMTNDFELVLCSTTWGDVRPYKFGKRIGENKAHFWFVGEIMDKYITAWQPLPEPYKKGGTE